VHLEAVRVPKNRVIGLANGVKHTRHYPVSASGGNVAGAK